MQRRRDHGRYPDEPAESLRYLRVVRRFCSVALAMRTLLYRASVSKRYEMRSEMARYGERLVVLRQLRQALITGTYNRFEQAPAELVAQDPKPISNLWIIGLPVCACLPLPVKVAARDLIDRLRDGQADNGLRPFLDRAHGVAEGALDHLGIHQGGRVQGVHGHAGAPQVLGQLEGEHDLG